jgi:uncharacterized protein
LTEILAQHPGIDEHELKEFIIRLYWLGLLQINKTSFFDSNAFKQGPICKPQSIFAIKLTDRCNLACSYCSANAASSRHGMDMDWDTAKKALDLIIDYPSKSAFIILIGGEPLLTLSLIEKMVHYAAKQVDKNIRFGLQTNGTLLSKSTLTKLEKLGIQVGLSLDGDQLTNDQTRLFPGNIGAHKTIIKGLSSAKNQMTGVICVVSKANYMRIPQIMDYFVSLGIRNVKLNPISRLGRAKQNWTELALTAEEFLHAGSEYLDYVADGFPPILEENTRQMIHNLASKMHHYFDW